MTVQLLIHTSLADTSMADLSGAGGTFNVTKGAESQFESTTVSIDALID